MAGRRVEALPRSSRKSQSQRHCKSRKEASRAQCGASAAEADVERPYLVTSTRPAHVRGVVVLAHGGREVGTAVPSRFAQGLLRLVPIARALARRGAPDGLLVAQLRYRMAGYNDGAPVEDVREGRR